MQPKTNDTPKIIGLIVAIVVVLIFFVWRLIPALQASAPTTGAAKTTDTNADTAAVTNTTPISASAGAAQPGQMRLFDDTIDADVPVGASGGGGNAFREIKAPTAVAMTNTRPTPTFLTPDTHPQKNNNLTIRPTVVPDNTPHITYVDAPPLEVRLDGVYEVGQERVAELTLRDTGAKDAKSTEQTVYRRVGEKIGRFKITGLNSAGVMLTGQARLWTVGEIQRLSQGKIAVMQAPEPAPANNTNALPPILVPGR